MSFLHIRSLLANLHSGICGKRETLLNALLNLPRANLANDSEVLQFIDEFALFGSGIGYIDAHLLASVRLTPETRLWTDDKRLGDAAARLDLAIAI